MMGEEVVYPELLMVMFENIKTGDSYQQLSAMAISNRTSLGT